VTFTLSSDAIAQWQWSTPVTATISNETKKHPQAFLWVPEKSKHLKAVLIGQHNMSEETIFENKKFRKAMSKLDIAIVWVSPGFDMPFDFNKGAGTIFEKMMESLGEISGYTELQYIPVIPIGHSAYATFPWNFAAWNPNHTLAILSVHGDAPQTNLTGYGGKNVNWGDRNIDGVPSLMIEGEYEWLENRVQPALNFKQRFPNAPVSFLCDTGHGHFDISNELIDYITLFIKKSIHYRLPSKVELNKPTLLFSVHPKQGWLKERWKKDVKPTIKSAPFEQYNGNKKEAFWYFDKEIAKATERYYAQSRGKKEQYIGYIQNGEILPFNTKSHARIQAQFKPDSDELTFHLNSVFTDTLRTKISNEHAAGKINISRICGPVEKVNDTTFTIRFYRMGLDNPKRTNDIWLMASHTGDRNFKSTVQQFNMRIPFKNTEGIEQLIKFNPIPNIRGKIKSIPLEATSDSGLPVYYYIKEGPAEIKNNTLLLTKVPLRSKYPIKITVVAWQYGKTTEPKIQTAPAVEQSFYLLK
jgi:hypothetical protein